jgi:hypothetical protein
MSGSCPNFEGGYARPEEVKNARWYQYPYSFLNNRDRNNYK